MICPMQQKKVILQLSTLDPQRMEQQLEEEDFVYVERDLQHLKEFNLENLLLLKKMEENHLLIEKNFLNQFMSLKKDQLIQKLLKNLFQKLVDRLEELGQSEILSNTIGTMVMEGLKELDPVAYVRFASVYRNFREEKDFVQFVDRIDVFKKDNFKSSDKKIMNFAINLAENNKYLTGTNPSVGCVIVKKKNIIICYY